MTSLVARESLLRKLVFPRLVIPMAATITAGLTFLVNAVVVAGFVAWEQITPRLDWLLVIPLLLELYVFTLGVALILATLFVRFRDMGQVWELGAPAALLRLADHLSDRLPPSVRARPRLPQPVHAGAPGHPRARPLPGPARQHDHRRRGIRDFGRLIPIGIAGGDPRRRPPAVQARRAVVRGARVSRPVIEVSGVSKAFRLPHERRTTLKEHFLHPFHRTSYEEQQALDDVSFTVDEGEFFGIIGPNGSGKSTLLKILAGIYRQDSGTVRVDGRLSPFIELGVGFNPELTAATTSGSTARCSASGSVSSRSASTRSSRSPASSGSSTRS